MIVASPVSLPLGRESVAFGVEGRDRERIGPRRQELREAVLVEAGEIERAGVLDRAGG